MKATFRRVAVSKSFVTLSGGRRYMISPGDISKAILWLPLGLPWKSKTPMIRCTASLSDAAILKGTSSEPIRSSCMLYFIGAGDRLKIGISSNPTIRRATLQTGNPMECRVLLALDVVNERDIEKMLHARLQAYREHGEWFRVSFSTAFEYLTDIREHLRLSDSKNLPPPAPKRLQLQDCAKEFETWLISTGRILPEQWDQETYPLWYLWDLLHEEFEKERANTKDFGGAPKPAHDPFESA